LITTLEGLVPKRKTAGLGRRMHVIVFHDVEVARLRKTNAFIGKYLKRREKSAFEGELTESQLGEMRLGLKRTIKEDEDGVLIVYKETGQRDDQLLVFSRVRSADNRILKSHKISLGNVSPPILAYAIGAWRAKKTLTDILFFMALKSIGL
jgi:CRISPR-associated endonuclease Cas2